MNIKPLSNNLLVRQSTKKDQKQGGIIVPDTVRKNELMGTVVGVGPGKMLEDGTIVKMTVKEGDTIVYKYGAALKLETEEYLMMTEDDVFGIIG